MAFIIFILTYMQHLHSMTLTLSCLSRFCNLLHIFRHQLSNWFTYFFLHKNQLKRQFDWGKTMRICYDHTICDTGRASIAYSVYFCQSKMCDYLASLSTNIVLFNLKCCYGKCLHTELMYCCTHKILV